MPELPSYFIDPRSLEIVSLDDYYRSITRCELEDTGISLFAISAFVVMAPFVNINIPGLEWLWWLLFFWCPFRFGRQFRSLRQMLDRHIDEKIKIQAARMRRLVLLSAIALPWAIGGIMLLVYR